MDHEIIDCELLGHLIYQVRKATKETGLRVISVDLQSERKFSFQLVDADHVVIREWRIGISKVAHRGNWGIPDADLMRGLPDLLPVRHTREIFAEWLSHRVTLEEAVEKCRTLRSELGYKALGVA